MIVYGSRGSDLALTQTRWVAERVRAETGEDFRIEVMVTTGDRIQDRPLAGIGVKGLFTKELEDALRDGSIDAAVHSLKDLPVADPAGVTLGAVPARVDPRDVLVTRSDALGDVAQPWQTLRDGATVGTSSPRRALAATSARADLLPSDIRGNVPTRVDKARRADYDAVLLAAAGLERLGQDLSGLVTEHLPVHSFTPAPGQGALGVQCRAGDERVLGALKKIHDEVTARCVAAERAVLLGLGGGCSMPLGVLVDPVDDRFRIRAALFGGAPNAALRTAAIGADPAELAAEVVSSWRSLLGAPLRGRRIATIRPDGERTGLTAALAIAGADVTALAWTRSEALAVGRDELEAVTACDALVFTSTRAVRHFVAACDAHGVSSLERPAVAVGAATATELVQRGFVDVMAAAGRGGEALAIFCHEAGLGSLGMPCAQARHEGFERLASKGGAKVLALPIYRLLEVQGVEAEIPTDLDAFLYTSPSAVEAWCHVTRGRTDLQAIAIGSTTRESLRSKGFRQIVSLSSPTPPALIEAVLHGTSA